MSRLTKAETILLWITLALSFIVLLVVIGYKLKTDELGQQVEFWENRTRQYFNSLDVCRGER